MTKILTYYWHFFVALMKNDGNDIKLRLYKGCHNFQIFIKGQKLELLRTLCVKLQSTPLSQQNSEPPTP